MHTVPHTILKEQYAERRILCSIQ